ncbi:AAA family ATPase [Elizabethkingia anophelis]|uniref:AAA family ATPase n=1 Tax=Elizabethkingia TaxID=308865 RepID=UPI0021A4ECBB|nr:AAA family ATPase [Elizabethkingia anophelis]MCT4193881.1 AAA family ATPase [Elizabethkingia anophelis]
MSKKELINIGDLLSKGILISGGQDYDDIIVPINPQKNNSINKPPNLTPKFFEEERYSGFNLFKMENEELPKLVDPIFPKVGVISLVGSSDTGKSTFLRQLALSIALNHESFVGYKINTTTRNVIYVSTEDDSMSTSISLKKQIRGLYPDGNIPENELNHLKFIFDINLGESDENSLYKLLEKDLDKIGADIVIIDAFTDIFSGDINSSTRVREFLNYFSKLSREYNCLVLFLHHTGKRTDKYNASKDNVLGSQAFEAKMRVLLELKHHPNDDSKRTLTITKGNYLSSDIKKYSKTLRFDEENLLFFHEGQVLTSSISSLSKTYNKKEEVLPLIKKLYQSKKSIREIESELKSKGYNIGKSTVSNYINEIK